MELLMSFSIQRETSDGTLSTLDLTIEYIDRTDVRAYVNDIEIDLTGGSTPYTWEWITDSQIKITPNVPNGLVAMLKRSTPMEGMYHIFDAGAVFKDETVDENFKQVLFLSQEAKEGSGVSDIYSDVNMHGYVIRNHGAATLDGDLVTFGQYRNDSLGAGFNRVAAEAARDVAVAAKDTAVAAANAAALSETNAAASELAAGNSATSANDDRVLAENAANTAVAAYDSFDDRYLGPKAADPTLDNDGAALLVGALYWNTIANEMRVYSGGAWVVSFLPATGYLEKAQNLADLADLPTTLVNLGLENVDNTSDASKPISTAQAAGLVAKDSDTGAANIPAGTTAQRPGSPTVSLFRYNTTLGEMERYQGGAWVPFNTTDKAFNEAPLTTVAASGTTDVGTAISNTVYISGSGTINSLGTAPSGARRKLIFQGVCNLTYNATSLILLGAANITTSAGDTAEFVSLGSGNWKCTEYVKFNGYALKAILSKEYVSSQQVITAGGLLTLAHGLAANPKLVQAFLVCQTAEQGYSVGDEVPVSLDSQGTNSLTWGAVCTWDTTNLYVRPSGTAGSFILLHKTSTAAFQITNANWRIIMRAWA